MVKITFITMPIVAVTCPSLGLTQLKDVTERAHGDRVDINLLYLQHEFAQHMAKADRARGESGPGSNLYDVFCGNQMHNTGLGDWFFRQVAFPDEPDNSDEYFGRYYPGKSKMVQSFRAALLDRRKGLADVLDSMIDQYAITESDIVGFSSMFQQNVATIAMIRRLKLKRPDLTIVVGGANCEPPMGNELMKGVDDIDYVFSGPALTSFPQFIGRYLEGDEAGMCAIKGVLSRSGPAKDEAEQMGEELHIDEDVGLDYTDFIESLERGFPGENLKPALFFETSRGCWWGERSHCTFCGLNGTTMAYRAMEPEKAVNLIQGLIDDYKDKTDFFFCVDNIMPTSYVKEVLPRIKLPKDSCIFYEVKANISDDVIKGFAEVGVKKIQPGIESLASSTLKLMHKGSTSFVNLRLLKSCVKHKVRPQWNLLLGFPGEGQDVYKMYVENLDRLSHLYPPDGAFPVRFDRYSPYFVKAKEYGLDLKPLDYYAMTYPFGEESLSRMAYYFTDANIQAPYVLDMLEWLAPIRERAAAWLAQWPGAKFETAPRLYLERNGTGGIIHDTRNGAQVEHAVSKRQLQVLDQLDLPRTREGLAKALGEEDAAEVEADLAFLDERKLLWKEDGRTMSLVVPEPY